MWIASTVSNFGGLIQGVGAAWLMTSITDSAAMVALVQASSTLPVMLFALMSGACADSFDRRRVMLVAQVFMALVALVLVACAWAGIVTPWLLLGLTFALGCGGAFHNPSWQASVGDVLPREDVPAAVLLNGMGFNVTRSVGPAIGGAVVATAGAVAAFAINAASYVGLIVVLWRWRDRAARPALPREALAAAMGTGLRYVAMSPDIVRVLLRGFVFGATTIVILALLPLVARHLVQGGAVTYGVLLGAFGIGAVGGAMVSRPLRERLSNETVVRVAFVAFAACAGVTALAPWMWLTALALAVGGAAWVLALALFNTTVQLSTPRWVVGRALSLYQMAIFGGMALGSWAWGALAEHQSVVVALLAAAATMVLGALLGLVVPLPSREARNLDPLGRWQVPEVARAPEPRNGPIAIAVEFIIDDGDVAEFQVLMRQRRRIRRRDGAHEWSLARDLADPRVWIERYQVPTWLDYQRFHSRATHADAHVTDRLVALHRGEHPPRVRRMLVWKGAAFRRPPVPDADEIV